MLVDVKDDVTLCVLQTVTYNLYEIPLFIAMGAIGKDILCSSSTGVISRICNNEFPEITTQWHHNSVL